MHYLWAADDVGVIDKTDMEENPFSQHDSHGKIHSEVRADLLSKGDITGRYQSSHPLRLNFL